MNYIVSDSSFAGVGLPILRPEAAWMKNKLREMLRPKLWKAGYQEVESPAIGDVGLFEKSGHYPYYRYSMFPLLQEDVRLGAHADYELAPWALQWALKPMNCPFHIGVYLDEPRSYRDLPLRFFEFGKVYRMEDSGAVNGLLRSRAFEQDDGHVFCADMQVGPEIQKILEMALFAFSFFGVRPRARLSVREENSDKYIGGDALWIHAENELRIALEEFGLEYQREEGAAFYGPKIDFVVQDKSGRDWQLGTIQLDFNLPKQFGLKYKGPDNLDHVPVMIHRALFGSLERFLGFLIQEDNIPDFIHPKLYAIVPVVNGENEMIYAESMSHFLFSKGNSNKVFSLDEPLKAKIKRAKDEGFRHVAVFGKKELARCSFSVDEYWVKIDNRDVRL